ncbi:FAD-binding domain-containing protein, partial [Aaosphaeria arxii CBS 175.79]
SQTCWTSPTCVLRVQNSTQVSLALKVITFLRVRFAVRSGGHSPNPGWASIDKGILIDLQDMNQISVSGDRGIARIGPGARWGEVYQFLDRYNVTVIGGRVPEVGVGGLMLGGGLSYFTGEYGLAVDNIESIEVVLADGNIIVASRSSQSDLFWALKGGGPNFGIVTRYNLRTVPVKNIWYQMMVYSTEKAPELLDAFAEWQKLPDTKGSIAMVATLTSVIVGLVYIEPVERPKVFQGIYDIEPLAVPVPSTIGTVLDLSQISSADMSKPASLFRHDYRGVSSRVDADLYKSTFRFWKHQATTIREATGANMTFVLQHVPKNVVDKGIENGGNALGLEPTTQQWWTTLIDWDDPADDDIVREAAIAVSEKWVEISETNGSNLDFIYMNDASRDQDPLGTYSKDSIQKLQRVAKHYDPSGIFQTLQNHGFLLSASVPKD